MACLPCTATTVNFFYSLCRSHWICYRIRSKCLVCVPAVFCYIASCIVDSPCIWSCKTNFANLWTAYANTIMFVCRNFMCVVCSCCVFPFCFCWKAETISFFVNLYVKPWSFIKVSSNIVKFEVIEVNSFYFVNWCVTCSDRSNVTCCNCLNPCNVECREIATYRITFVCYSSTVVVIEVK